MKLQIHLAGSNKEHILLGSVEVPLARLANSGIFGAQSLKPQSIEENYKITLAAGVLNEMSMQL